MLTENKWREITLSLIRKKLTITTMESITAGEIASLITDTEGASAVLKGAFVTYSNEAKISRGVPAETIERFGVYSEETALAMAKCCKTSYSADIGIGITGTAGNPDPANGDSVPGRVHFAIDFKGNALAWTVVLAPMKQRHDYKLAAADCVAEKLLNLLSDETR